MDEKTEELRDIFLDVTDDGTVTESQEAGRGSLTDADDADVAARLADVVERMRERYAFATDLSTDALVALVRGFYDGDDDDAIAAALDVDPETVFAARTDLHLLRDGDADVPFDLAALREARADDAAPDVDALAAELDAAPETVRRALRVADAQAQARRASHRFQSAFEDAIPDAAISASLTDAAQEDGLREAAEDIETNTQL
ncbi:MAG: conditioned medium-induced protein 4 [Haloarculaceae archaeon]